MDRWVSRAICGLRHENVADNENEVDTCEVVDEPTHEADSEAVKSLVHQQNVF